MQAGHWIIAATRMELIAVWSAIYPAQSFPEKPWRIVTGIGFGFTQVECWCQDPQGPWFSVTGPGMPQSLMRGMAGVLELQPKAIWQVGIAGAYRSSELQLGQTVWVTEECVGDLGLEIPDSNATTNSGFRSMHLESWAETDACGPWPLANPMRDYSLNSLVWCGVKGVTVSMVTGTEKLGQFRSHSWSAQIETMEGAALALLGRHFGLPAYQIRTISNIAALRNWTPDTIQRALSQLTDSIAEMFRQFSKVKQP
jgi:futalosine hydrolase